ncbi:21 kDa protein-like [Canna indica]|uniref:21 kDa protein-like n=1 Tax=Canna indica TaxID=4628 RepID=A0AAQ3KIL4_9LILI|nr:21 kDa protein-like [Canna indica]
MLAKAFLLSSFFLPLVVCSLAAPPAPAPEAPADDESPTGFIRAQCGATRYPDLCFTSLSGYASAVQHSPLQLACAAANVTLSRLRSLRAHVSALRSSGTGAGSEAAAALSDCEETLDAAGSLVSRSAGELRGLESLQGSEAAWRVSNAQTWMSAAMTNEDTCADGLESVSGGDVKVDVSGQVRGVKQFTSNALALVNRLAGGR